MKISIQMTAEAAAVNKFPFGEVKYKFGRAAGKLILVYLTGSDGKPIIPNRKDKEQQTLLKGIDDLNRYDVTLGWPFENAGAPKDCFSGFYDETPYAEAKSELSVVLDTYNKKAREAASGTSAKTKLPSAAKQKLARAAKKVLGAKMKSVISFGPLQVKIAKAPGKMVHVQLLNSKGKVIRPDSKNREQQRLLEKLNDDLLAVDSTATLDWPFLHSGSPKTAFSHFLDEGRYTDARRDIMNVIKAHNDFLQNRS